MLRISTPGRICLFGEHQDYLLLPVVPCAISLRISVEGTRRDDRTILLHLPDLRTTETFSLEGTLSYGVERDYFKSSVNVLRRKGFLFSHGVECTVHGNIPINSGTSSSSALIVTWMNFLTRLSDQETVLPPMELARLAHEAEVVEFGEPGGMMDHYSTACGRVIAIDFHPDLQVEPLDVELGAFVLGDSGEPKDTKGILARVKNRVLDLAKRLSGRGNGFSLHSASAENVQRLGGDLTGEERGLLLGTIRNRDLTAAARTLLHRRPVDHRSLGSLLSEHQQVLRDVLRISTPKIDAMLDAAKRAGAYGGKINGSGGGGCMFVYAPDDPARVARAVEAAGGKAYVVRADEGTRLESAKQQ